MAALSLTGEALDTLTPITDKIGNGLFAKNEIVNEWVFDPSRKYTHNADLNSLLNVAWKQMCVASDSNNTTTFVDVPSSTKEQSFVTDLQEKIFNKLSFPNHWIQEGIKKPNVAAKNNALQICKELYLKYNFNPDKILPTKEEGIYITYDLVNENTNRSLVIETYNDAETALAICDNLTKKIIYSEDITNNDFTNAIRNFKEANN